MSVGKAKCCASTAEMCNKKERAAETCEMLSGSAHLSYAHCFYATELQSTVPPVQHMVVCSGLWRSHHMWPPNVPMQLNSEAE